MGKMTRKSKKDLYIQILIGLLGFMLSLILHELFHILVHWNHIQKLDFFPNMMTVVQVDVMLPAGYDIEGEEIAAYGITLLVMILTVMAIYKVRDTDDKRSVGQILFPNDRKMQKMNPSEMLELSGLNQNDPITPQPPVQAPRQQASRTTRPAPVVRDRQQRPATRRLPKRLQ